MKEYVTVREIAGNRGASARWVVLCIRQGRIPGVERFGKCWAVPENAVKPVRLRTGPKRSSEDR